MITNIVLLIIATIFLIEDHIDINKKDDLSELKEEYSFHSYVEEMYENERNILKEDLSFFSPTNISSITYLSGYNSKKSHYTVEFREMNFLVPHKFIDTFSSKNIKIIGNKLNGVFFCIGKDLHPDIILIEYSNSKQ